MGVYDRSIDAAGFSELTSRLATAWSTRDTALALSCFADDAVYMEPPDIQLFRGHEQLARYFAALTSGTSMAFHNVWFDEEAQTGAGEYSFGVNGQNSFDHGIAVMEIRGGVIATWREYQSRGPAAFTSFVAVEGKEWRWHIGNYP
jgi:ketosteroid isomerase-like protein